MTQVAQSEVSRSLGPWQPLRNRTFRNLLASNLISDIGTFMQSVGAAWLMTSLTRNPLYIALIQTASALPFFLLALPAGSIGDIFDRRKLILGTETWMLVIAVVLTVATFAGVMTPWLLLLLTLGLSIGDAVESPTWRAIFPELVDKEELPAALALNGIEFNLARAVGPGLGGFIVASVGVGAAFAFNALSFFGVIAVIERWKRPVRKSTLPAETFRGATSAAIRYVRYSPGIRRLLLRSAVLIFFTSSFWALLPTAARELSKSPIAYGFLLGSFGLGAVLGAVVLQRTRSKLSTETLTVFRHGDIRRNCLKPGIVTYTGDPLLPHALWRRLLDRDHVPLQHHGAGACTRLGKGASARSLSLRLSRERYRRQHSVGLCSVAHECPCNSCGCKYWNGCMPIATALVQIAGY